MPLHPLRPTLSQNLPSVEVGVDTPWGCVCAGLQCNQLSSSLPKIYGHLSIALLGHAQQDCPIRNP